MRVRIQLISLMRIRILAFKLRLNLQIKCSKRLIYTFWLVICKPNADPDSAYHFRADGDPDPTFHSDEDSSGSGSTALP
jgi:hypothetical protein